MTNKGGKMFYKQILIIFLINIFFWVNADEKETIAFSSIDSNNFRQKYNQIEREKL
jgi:hypothetical protein